MALINDKFTTIKQLIIDHHPNQAKDECDNGVGICTEARAAFENIKGKLIDKFGEDELMSVDFEGAINEYFTTP